MEHLDLTYFFKTKSQATDFSTRLSNIIQRLYENDFSLEKALLETFGVQKKDKFIALLRDNQINVDKLDTLKAFLLKIQDTVSKLPVLDITLAFDPKEKNLQAISDWFVMNINKQVLLNITVDTKIIGGAKVNYQGKYLDVSIKPIFDKILTPVQPHPINTNEANNQQVTANTQ